jgi:hypothetical protein
MNPADFLSSLETVLRARHVEFSRAALQCFVDSTWDLILDRQEPEFWADRFLEGADLMAPA